MQADSFQPYLILIGWSNEKRCESGMSRFLDVDKIVFFFLLILFGSVNLICLVSID